MFTLVSALVALFVTPTVGALAVFLVEVPWLVGFAVGFASVAPLLVYGHVAPNPDFDIERYRSRGTVRRVADGAAVVAGGVAVGVVAASLVDGYGFPWGLLVGVLAVALGSRGAFGLVARDCYREGANPWLGSPVYRIRL